MESLGLGPAGGLGVARYSGPEKQKGHLRSLMPHGDAMKMQAAQMAPLSLVPERLRSAVRIAVRAGS